MRLQDKVVVLTGAASGMGESHARRLVQEGARVLMLDIDASAGQSLAEKLGDAVAFLRHDVSREEDWERAVEFAVQHFGGIDVLVNNAGIHSFGSMAEESADTLTRVLEVNVVGTWLGIQKVSPVMKARGGGSIVNLSSLVGMRGLPDYSIYGCSKWAVRGLTKHAAAELGPDNIRINAVLPGAIDSTGMFDSSAAPGAVGELLEATPLKRFGKREDVSSLIVYLASDESCFTTGADHVIDGGKGI